MRGTHRSSDSAQPLRGIIPAYAGNTSRQDTDIQCGWDHPRVCGEHTSGVKTKLSDPGSSPRMRGTLLNLRVDSRNGGIIPAYAGNTDRHELSGAFRGDHPRVCGEHLTGNPYLLMVQGSSPRMRGTLFFWTVWSSDSGIIPAYAGNTDIMPLRGIDVRDHPRVCGEHPFLSGRIVRIGGSSPRMRGTLGDCLVLVIGCGIIPAYAGNTSAARSHRIRSRDHPRVCGEHKRSTSMKTVPSGSSPRMRGTRPNRRVGQ